MPKILLMNYSKQAAAKVSKELAVDIQRGYIEKSSSYGVNELGVSTTEVLYYIPESFAEYKAIFINFDISDAVRDEFADIAVGEYEKNGHTFLTDYWFNNRGYLVVFTGGDLIDLPTLGIPIKAIDAQQTDKSAHLGISYVKQNPFRVSMGSLVKDIKMPASHYLSAGGNKAINEWLESGHLDCVFVNSSDKAVGVYIDSDQDRNDYGSEDSPQALILPAFKSLSKATVLLTQAFAKMSPQFLPLSNDDWFKDTNLYPKSVKEYENEILEIRRVADENVAQLQETITKEIENNSAFLKVLSGTGDDLVDAVNWLLSNVVGLDVTDVDDQGNSGNLKEDLLLKLSSGKKFLAEVKGTKAEYPSPKYIGQATNHFIRKAKLGAEKCILVVNHDYTNDPAARIKAYTGDDAELLESVEYVSYLDTRILHKICLGIMNGNISSEEAIIAITSSGRIEYPAQK